MITSGVRVRLRQWMLPKEFRIPRPRLDGEQAAWAQGLLAAYDGAVAELQAAAAHRPDAEPEDPARIDTDELARAGTAMWRAQRRLAQEREAGPNSGQIAKYMRITVRSLKEALDLDIQDHTGDRYDPGQSLQVLEYEDVPGLTQEVVTETEKPSIYFRGELVQRGQVVVGRPPNR